MPVLFFNCIIGYNLKESGVKFESNMNIIAFDSFEPDASIVSPDDADSRRRFTILLDEGSVSTGFHHIRRVSNTAGETFALKMLRSLNSVPQDDALEISPTAAKAFFEEYRNQAAVSHLPGFPRVYGCGYIGDSPAILLEWIEGITLQNAIPALREANDGIAVSARTTASLGHGIGEIILRTQSLEHPFAHRDISTRNIMIRTSMLSLEHQIERERFDLCLIDMGSSSYKRADTTFTMRTDIWRNGTPEFAPPEMLTSDIPELAHIRTSPTIDSYEICSVLYTLYAGHTPYRLGEREVASPYAHKRDNPPEPLEPRNERDRMLVDTILAGIHADQSRRIPVGELTGRLEAWLEGIDFEPRTPLTQDLDTSREDAQAKSSATSSPVEPRISRRTFIALGGAGIVTVAASAVMTRGWGLLDRLEGKKPRLGDYSWAELAGISRQIAEADSYDAGMKIARAYHLADADGKLTGRAAKDFSLKDGTKMMVEIVGIRQDIRAGRSDRTVGLTFMTTTPLAARPMNDATALGGWEQSTLRAWMNSELIEQFPEEVATRVTTVQKPTNNTGATTSADAITMTDDRLWIPSMSELCGVQGPETFSEDYRYLSALYSNEGSQYLLFDQLGVSGLSANESLVLNRDGNRVFWWERTPSPDISQGKTTTAFNRVGREGDAFSHATSGSSPRQKTYVVVGFCL